jgi:hypothetical protein
MAGIITTISTKPFQAQLNADDVRNKSQHAVRRPLLGTFQSRETFATLALENFSPGSVEAGLANSSEQPNLPATGTANFLLLTVQEQRIEKSQILTTFGTSYAYFFGEQPRQIEVSALLLNTADFRWDVEWLYNYENFLRGSKLTASNTVIIFTYDNCIVRGYMTACSIGKSAENPRGVPLSFSMFVLDTTIDETAVKSRKIVVDRTETSSISAALPPPGTESFTNLVGRTVVWDRSIAVSFGNRDIWEGEPLEYVSGGPNTTVRLIRSFPPIATVEPSPSITDIARAAFDATQPKITTMSFSSAELPITSEARNAIRDDILTEFTPGQALDSGMHSLTATFELY